MLDNFKNVTGLRKMWPLHFFGTLDCKAFSHCKHSFACFYWRGGAKYNIFTQDIQIIALFIHSCTWCYKIKTHTQNERLAEEGAACWGSVSKRNPLTSTSQSCTRKHHNTTETDRKKEWEGKQSRNITGHVTIPEKKRTRVIHAGVIKS